MSEYEPGPADLPPEIVRVIPLPQFAMVEEPGIDAILGSLDQNLIPVGGDVMLYGDGGAGKTTLAIDLAFHLASGLDWLGIPIEKPRSVLLIENEGPRPLFRRKLRKKFATWNGPSIEERLHVWEEPWASFSFIEQEMRAFLSRTIFEREIDLVIAGPVTQLGMEDAGTIREVRTFAQNVATVRERSLRPVASLLVHHESKSGRVSGAWEGVGDTLLHISGSGHGRTRMDIQKARWGPAYHATTLRLRWSDGQGFEVDEDAEDRPARIWDAIVAFVIDNPGTGWTPIEKVVGKTDYVRRRRDQMLQEGVLIDLGKGEIGRGHRFELWHVDDPDRPVQLPGMKSPPRNLGTAGTRGLYEEEGTLPEESPSPLVRSRGDSSGFSSPRPTEVAPEVPDDDRDIEW